MALSNQELLIVVGLPTAGALFYAYQIIDRARRELEYRLTRCAVFMLSYGAGVAVLTRQGVEAPTTAILSVLAGFGVASILVTPPKMSRKVPKRIRRAVIARDMGDEYDPTKHDIDHIVPYSKGGDHSVKNLRVIHKGENRSRGNKMPKWTDFF